LKKDQISNLNFTEKEEHETHMTQNPFGSTKETHNERENKQQEINNQKFTLVDINIINNVNELKLKDLAIRKGTNKKTEISNQNNNVHIKNKGIKHLQLRMDNTIIIQDKTISQYNQKIEREEEK
jgi:hypothetical protein